MSNPPPKRIDPVAGARLELDRVRAELARAKAITALLDERAGRLESWIAEADRIGLDAGDVPIPAFPQLSSRYWTCAASSIQQWDWVRFALLQSFEPMEPKQILALIEAEGGPPIDRTSLASLLSKRARIGQVEHVGRAWRLVASAR